MKNRRRGLVLMGLVAMFVFAFGASALARGHTPNLANQATGGGLEAAAIGEMGDTTVTPPLTDVLDLPALNIQEDAQGRIVMDLPGLKMVGPGGGPKKLPTTGVNAGDMLGLGLAALSGGGVLMRRLRVSLAA